MRLQFDEGEWILLPGALVLSTGTLHSPLVLNISFYSLHCYLCQEGPHVTVSDTKVLQEGDNLSRNVVPVDVLVGVSVGGAEVKGGDDIVELIVHTVQVGGVDHNRGSSQSVVKSIIGEFLWETRGIND